MKDMTFKPLFTRILCPVDLHDDFRPVLRFGRRLAERNAAKLVLIYVITPMSPGGVVLRRELDEAREALNAKIGNELAGIDHEVIVRWGNPAKEIVGAATQLDAELCLMRNDGSLGSSHLWRSTVEKVARRSSCPVMMMRAGHENAHVSDVS